MKRWQKTLLVAVAWIVLTIGGAIVHTNVILAGRLTPDQDDAISQRYGIACGAGLVLIGAVFYLRKESRR